MSVKKHSNDNSTIFLPSDVEGIKEIRNIFDGGIPSDLDTDLNLRRWIRGWKGQINEIEPRLRAYIENRKIAKLDAPDYLDTFENNPVYIKYHKYFSISRHKNVVNSKDNCVLLFERMGNIDFNKMTKVIPCGEFNFLYFVVCEGLLRQILKQEKSSGKPSGLTVIYDMAGFNIMDYANPNSAILKITKHCFALLQDYYCDILHQIYIVNAPTLLSLMWELVKRFMNPATQKKIVILSSNFNEELQSKIDLDVLPICYGGKRRDTSGLNEPETCCPKPAQITEEDFYVARPVDEFCTEYLKPGVAFEVKRKVEKSHAKLYWQYRVNSDVEFGLVKVTTGKN